jgi:homogentisate 1,2-dioxygenase
VLRATQHALAMPQLQSDYDSCWQGIRKHFKGGNA